MPMGARSPSVPMQGEGCEDMTNRPVTRLIEVTLDQHSIGHAGSDIEHERATAIWDLIEDNSFWPCADPGQGPYRLHISLMDNRLVLDVKRENGEQVVQHHLSLTPFRKVVKDYFLICESYYAAIRTASPARSRRSTWAGAACTMMAPNCCWNACRARSRWISTPHAASLH